MRILFKWDFHYSRKIIRLSRCAKQLDNWAIFLHDPTWTYWKISCEGNLSTHHYKTSWEKIERLQIILTVTRWKKNSLFLAPASFQSLLTFTYQHHHDLKIKLFQKVKIVYFSLKIRSFLEKSKVKSILGYWTILSNELPQFSLLFGQFSV